MKLKIQKKCTEFFCSLFLFKEYLEQDLEDWIENDSSILGENLLIIGRQAQIPEVNDRIDLLALDTNLFSCTLLLVKEKKEKIEGFNSLENLIE